MTLEKRVLALEIAACRGCYTTGGRACQEHPERRGAIIDGEVLPETPTPRWVLHLLTGASWALTLAALVFVLVYDKGPAGAACFVLSTLCQLWRHVYDLNNRVGGAR